MVPARDSVCVCVCVCLCVCPQSAALMNEAVSERQRRIEAMRVASGAVRSAYARAMQSRAGRDKDKLNKARSHKARKVRQSNLSKEWERQKSDDEPDMDYGPEYEDPEDDELIGGCLIDTHTHTHTRWLGRRCMRG